MVPCFAVHLVLNVLAQVGGDLSFDIPKKRVERSDQPASCPWTTLSAQLPPGTQIQYGICYFGCLKRASRSVEVLLNGIEAVLVYTEIDNSEIASLV